VFEKDETKAEGLAVQRPTWSVISGDAERGLRAGLGAHIAANVLDIDPYGDPWPFVEAFLFSDRALPDRLGVVVNDGLRHKLKLNAGWKIKSLEASLKHFGNASLYERYAQVCEWNMRRLADHAGYKIARWSAYYCGAGKSMTHYAAILER
jgi:hypothetical protein